MTNISKHVEREPTDQGLELTSDELEQVSGGSSWTKGGGADVLRLQDVTSPKSTDGCIQPKAGAGQ